jgi:ubiquinone biosynthesis protein
VALGQNATLMGETFRILALLVLSLPAIVVLALVGTRMLGVRRSWVAIAISGVVGWVVGLAVAFAVSGGSVRDAEFLRNALLLGFLATMTTAVALDLLAKPGTLSQGDAAGRFVMPRPKRYVEERVDVVRRSREIAEILRANGFGPQLGWTRRRREEAALARDAAPVRARQALEQCGGMFVKLGQIASTRSDLLPPEFIDELSKLQSDVAPADPVAIRALIEAELGAPVGEVFSEFDWDPIGTASIAQVYRATLHSGEPVVVKAQRPEIPEIVRRDTEVLLRVAGAVERNTPWGESYQVSTIAKDFADGVRAELDFRQEGRNAAAIGSNMASIPGVVVPRVFDDYTTSRVLVQERFDGPEASDDGALADRSLDRRHLADVLLRAALKQMMTDGWFHADLHPGNVLVLGAGAAARLGIIDFGACGRLDPLQQAALRQMLIATALRDAGMLRQAVADTCEIGAEVDDESLERALARFLALNVQPGQAVSATAVSDLMQLLDGFRASSPALRHGRPGPAHQPGDARVPLRQAPPDLRHQPQRHHRGHRARRRVARGRHQEDRPAAVQQLGPGVEPHLLLELPEPDGGGEPTGEVAEQLDQRVRLVRRLPDEFTEAAKTQFGSGWAWLVDDGSGLEVMKTANADLPMKHGAKALLTIDVWEHAYYIDFRNARPKYIDNFFDSLVNWDFVAQNLGPIVTGSAPPPTARRARRATTPTARASSRPT